MLELKKETHDLYERLAEAKWFVGFGSAEEDDVASLQSMIEAEESCLSIKWENVKIAARNVLTIELFRRNAERYNLWSEYLAAVKVKFEPLIKLKAYDFIESSFNQSAEIMGSISWDIVNASMEIEYSEIYDCRFYRNLMEWYVRGHLPCGWEGTWPGGRLIIF